MQHVYVNFKKSYDSFICEDLWHSIISLVQQLSNWCSKILKEKCFLVNDQNDAQFFTMYLFLFLFLTLFVFRAHRAHHQERQIVSMQPLVTVTLFTVGGRVVCR